MDLNQFFTGHDQGAVMQVNHPATNEPMTTADGRPVTITLLSSDHPRVRHEHQAQLVAFSERKEKVTPEEAERASIEVLAAATTGWENVGLDSDDTPFSKEAAIAAYSKLNWLRLQVDNFVAGRANFFKASSST